MPSLWSFALASFLPAMIYEIGTGAIIPIIVTSADDLGASTVLAAFTSAEPPVPTSPRGATAQPDQSYAAELRGSADA